MEETSLGRVLGAKLAAGLGYRKSRSEARWREEVMPGETSGEVRPTASGSDARFFGTDSIIYISVT